MQEIMRNKATRASKYPDYGLTELLDHVPVHLYTGGKLLTPTLFSQTRLLGMCRTYSTNILRLLATTARDPSMVDLTPDILVIWTVGPRDDPYDHDGYPLLLVGSATLG